jgi:hypothetical protein
MEVILLNGEKKVLKDQDLARITDFLVVDELGLIRFRLALA